MSEKIACRVPPALTDEQLVAYIENRAEQHIKEHLEVCAFCRARLDDIEFENILKTALYRFDCLDSQKLTDFAMERLPEYERDHIQKHLDFCLTCREEIKMLQSFLELENNHSEALPESLSIQPKRKHQQDYVAHIAEVPRASVLRSLRGRRMGPILASISDNLNVFVEYSESVQVTVLKGQIAADDLDTWTGSMVAIYSNLNLVTTATVDEIGGFQCELEAIIPVQIRITSPSGETISIPELILDDMD